MIIPCLYIKKGKVVDPKNHQHIDVNLMPKFLAEISLCPEVAIICLDREPKTNDSMWDLMKMNSCSVQCATENVNALMDLLDNGAKHVVVRKECLSDDLPLSSLPQGRITLAFSHANLVKYSLAELAGEISSFKEQASRFLLYQTNFQTDQGLVSFAKELKKLIPNTIELVICVEQPVSPAAIAELHLQGFDVQISMTCLLSDLSLGNIIASCLKSDRPDGLFPTVVTDEHGVALGLVYSNAESIQEAVNTKKGVYFSRKRGLWRKGETSGNEQELMKILLDCDCDTLKFVVRQQGQGFCHLNTWSCFGGCSGLASLMNTLSSRKQCAPVGSYTDRLYKDSQLLHAKIREEANELCEADNKEDILWEAADVLYFTLVKCAKAGVSLVDIERILDKRALKIRRRQGDAKPETLLNSNGVPGTMVTTAANNETNSSVKASKSVLRCYDMKSLSGKELQDLCKRPAAVDAAKLGPIVKGIIANVCSNGDRALLELTEKFDKVKLASPIIEVSSVQEPLLESKVKDAIDLAYENIFKFHKAQLNLEPMVVETCKGVICSRHPRPIEKVGLYVPGGSAVLPSTALMLGIPAQVAGCKEVILATPPTLDGFVSHEILYIAKKVGISKILLAGGAQAVAAMTYGTESVPKVDKLCGPGNQFVTLAKMLVQNDSSACISIDMPAGPSEVMVIADNTAEPSFVAADLLSQAEHGADSQVVLVAVSLNDKQLQLVQDQMEIQARMLSREQIVRAALSHSFVLNVSSMSEALFFSNKYAPEHLIINAQNAEDYLKDVQNAGSVFLGPYSPESCGDYASGTNHTLPTYGYARMYSGVSTATFMKHITAQCVSQDGLANIGPAVATLAAVENLDAHRNAVLIRQGQINSQLTLE